MSYRWSSWVLSSCAFACGPQVANDGGDTDEGGSSTDGTDDAGVEVGTTTTTMSSDDGVDTSTTEPPPPSTGLCGSDETPTPIAVVVIGPDDVVVVHTDGSLVSLPLPTSAAPPESDVFTSVDAHGDVVAVVRGWTHLVDGVGQNAADLTVLDASGNVLQQLEEPNATLYDPFVNDDGSVIVGRADDEGEAAVLFTLDSPPLPMPGFRHQGPRRDDGWVPGVWVSPEGVASPGWFEPVLGEHRPVWLEANGEWHVREDGSLVYFADDAGGRAIVHDLPSGTALVVPTSDGEIAGLGMSISSDGRWVLVGDATLDALRIAIDDGITLPIDLTPPPGFTALSCYDTVGSIDDDGAVLIAVRDAAIAQAMRFDPEAAAWTELGEPLTAIDDVEVWSRGGSYIVHSRAQGTTFCPPTMFEPSPDTLTGEWLQLLRPVAGFGQAYDATTISVLPRADGRCIGLVREGALDVVDLDGDGTQTIDGGRTVRWWRP